jgi:hypothetical protein
MIHRFCLGKLNANPCPKKERRCAVALHSTPSGPENRIEENEPVNDIRRRVAMRRKGGYVEYATKASTNGKRIPFKLRRCCCELKLRANLPASPAANHTNILAWGPLSSSSLDPVAQSRVEDATPSGTKARRRPVTPGVASGGY